MFEQQDKSFKMLAATPSVEYEEYEGYEGGYKGYNSSSEYEGYEGYVVSEYVTQNISLFIPRVFPNITEVRIMDIFHENNIGEVHHVDLVGKLDALGRPYNCAYVHFDCWYDNPTAFHFYKRVVDPHSQAKIVYDDPWFWIVLKNSGEKRLAGAPKIVVDLSTNAGADADADADALSAKRDGVGFSNGKKLLTFLKQKTTTTTTTTCDEASDEACGKLDLVSCDYVSQIEDVAAKLFEENNRLRKDLKLSELMGYQQAEIMEKLELQVHEMSIELNNAQYAYLTLLDANAKKAKANAKETAAAAAAETGQYVVVNNDSFYFQPGGNDEPLTMADLDTRACC